jgi:hypothetical protein
MRSRGALLGLLLVLAAPQVAGAQTIGANLARPANAAYGCEALPTTDAFGRRFFQPTGAATCTYVGTGSISGQGEVAQARFPGGVVTRVRVKAGPVVGPVQVTVLRAMRGFGGVRFSCCFFAGASQVFTPAPNAVTSVAVRLPMRNDITPNVGETVDYLGLTVLAPGVPIPMHEIGNPGDVSGPGGLAFFPHVDAANAANAGRPDYNGVGGLVPLVQGDFVRLCNGRAVGARARAAQGRCLPGIAAIGARASLRGGRLVVRLVCNAGFPCAGSLRVQPRSRGGATLARGTVNVPPGGRQSVRARVSRAGRRALRRGARRWLNVRVGTPSGQDAVVSTRLRIR